MDILDINKILRKTAKELEEERLISLINIIMTLLAGKKRVPIEQIIIETRFYGYTQDEVYRAIEKLKKDGVVEEKNGYLYTIA